MGSVEGTPDAATRWDIATPSRPLRLPGLKMAGFRDRGTDLLDLEVVPYPAVTIVVDLGGDGVVVGDPAGRYERGSLAFGLAPGSVRAQGRRIECLQVRLSPVLAHAVLGTAADLSGTMAPLDALWGHDAPRIQERLRAARSWDERFAIAEAAVARRAERGRPVDPEVSFAWTQMLDTRGQLRVDDLVAELGWSRKRLWSRCRSQLGITPKRAARLVRFDHAVHRLAAGDRPARVAAESGYTDQSHLHRDVVDFAGVPPTAAAAAPWLAVDDRAWSADAPAKGP